MKNSQKDPENSPFFHSKDLVGSSGSLAKTSKASDPTKELPKEFVKYLKSLFDILDQDGCGYIKLTDIETYWDTKGPSFSAMLDYLRETSPDNGLINFEALCTGLKLASQTANNGTSHSVHKDNDWASDSSEDSFRLHDDGRKYQIMKELEQKRESEERQDILPTVNTTNNDITRVKMDSTSKVYFVGKEPSSSSAQLEEDGLRGGSDNTVTAQKTDMKSRSRQVEEELEVLKNGLLVIEKARSWYFRRFTAVQEEKLLHQQSDKNSLEQFQYEMLLQKTRRKELDLNETVFKCYKENIQEINKYMTKLIENPHELLNTSKSVGGCSPDTKEQLKQLKNEILEKDSKIAQLEKEKSALIKDLFQVKAAASGGILNK